PGLVVDRGLGHHDGRAVRRGLRERLVDRVDLDVRPRLGEVGAARGEPAPADLVGRLPHRVPLEAGDLRDLPAEQGRVELARPGLVGDGDVDVGDVAVCHVASLHAGPALAGPVPTLDPRADTSDRTAPPGCATARAARGRGPRAR